LRSLQIGLPASPGLDWKVVVSAGRRGYDARRKQESAFAFRGRARKFQYSKSKTGAKQIMIKSMLCAFLLSVSMFVVSAPSTCAQQAEGSKQPRVYTYVSFFGVPRADWARFESGEGQQRKIFDGLVADGTLLGYGDAAAEVHEGLGSPTHASWFTSSSVSGLMKTLAAVRGGVSPDIAYTMHSDSITASTMYGGKGGSADGGFIVVQEWMPKPGHSTEFNDLFAKYRKPSLDAGVANGAISGYSLEQDLIHTEAPGTYDLVVTVPNAAALDKFYAEIDALHTTQPLFGAVYDSTVDESAHRDHLFRILHSSSK
jgi:hypothetical protein